MKPFIFLMVAALSIVWLTGSAQKEDVPAKKKPHEEIKVNKKYDEQGNLTSYDSTYVYTWSGDSTMTSMPEGFNPDMFKNFGPSFFGNDSSFFNAPFGNMFGAGDHFRDMMDHFNQMFSDTTGMQYFSFQTDSLPNDTTGFHQFYFGNGDMMKHFNMQQNDSLMARFFSGFGDGFFFSGQDSVAMRHNKMLQEQLKNMEKMQREFFGQ